MTWCLSLDAMATVADATAHLEVSATDALERSSDLTASATDAIATAADATVAEAMATDALATDASAKQDSNQDMFVVQWFAIL